MSDLRRQIETLPDDTPHKWALIKIVQQLDRTQALVWGILGAILGAFVVAPLFVHVELDTPWSLPTATGYRVLFAVVGFFSAVGLKGSTSIHR